MCLWNSVTVAIELAVQHHQSQTGTKRVITFFFLFGFNIHKYLLMTALGSRSSSVERNSVTGATQPFVGETCKVPLSVPNTLEEARRRLEDDVRARTKQRLVIYYAVSEVSPYKSTNKRFCTLSVLNKKTLVFQVVLKSSLSRSGAEQSIYVEEIATEHEACRVC